MKKCKFFLKNIISKPNGNGCQGVAVQAGKLRYCKVVFAYSCTKTVTTPGSLSGLSVTGFNISPAFSAGQYSYAVDVASSTTSVQINATAASGSTLVDGYGSRTVNVNVGETVAEVRVSSSGGTSTYYITFRRPNSTGQTGPTGPNGPTGPTTPATPKDTDNTLKRITVDKGELTPAFSPTVNYYDVEVEGDVEKLSFIAENLNELSAADVSFFNIVEP